jgi:hypothetical protein
MSAVAAVRVLDHLNDLASNERSTRPRDAILEANLDALIEPRVVVDVISC